MKWKSHLSPNNIRILVGSSGLLCSGGRSITVNGSHDLSHGFELGANAPAVLERVHNDTQHTYCTAHKQPAQQQLLDEYGSNKQHSHKQRVAKQIVHLIPF